MSLEVSRSPAGLKILTTMSLVVTASAAVATMDLLLPSLTSNWCLGPQPVAVTVPWNWYESLAWSTWL